MWKERDNIFGVIFSVLAIFTEQVVLYDADPQRTRGTFVDKRRFR